MELIPEIDEKINEIAEGWRTRRMGKVELTILRLAVFEMKYDEEIRRRLPSTKQSNSQRNSAEMKLRRL